MASYDVALTSSAEKELKKLSSQLIARISRVWNISPSIPDQLAARS